MIRLRLKRPDRKAADSAGQAALPATGPAARAPVPSGAPSTTAPAAADEQVRVNPRRFVQLLAAAGAAGVALAAARPRPAAADYSDGPGSSPDTVTTDLTVQGSLTVNGNVGLATTPRVRLDVAGPIGSTNGGFVSTLDGAHVGYNTYFVPGTGWRNLDATKTGAFLRFDGNSILVYSAGSGVSPAVSPSGGWYFSQQLFYWMGSVGIGTFMPVAKLEVAGDVRVNGPVNVNGTIAIDSSAVATKSYYAP